MEQAHPAPDQERVEGRDRRVPGHVPAHEVAVADAFLVGPLTEHRVGDVARMQVGQLADLGGHPRAAFALLGGGMPVPPHEVVGDQLTAPFERVEQRDRSARPGHREAGVHLDHGQPPPRRGDRVAFSGVRLFPDPQPVEFGLEGCPVNGSGQARLGGGG
jgi:hypothetical protein